MRQEGGAIASQSRLDAHELRPKNTVVVELLLRQTIKNTVFRNRPPFSQESVWTQDRGSAGGVLARDGYRPSAGPGVRRARAACASGPPENWSNVELFDGSVKQ